MNKMNNAGRLLVLLLAALMALSLAACGAKGVGKMGSEPKSLEEAVAMHKELMAEETAIFSENTALWEKVFMEADKGMAMVEDGKNYGDFLLDTIESAKDQFTASEAAPRRSEEDSRYRKRADHAGGKVSRGRGDVHGQRYEYAGRRRHEYGSR